MLLSQWADLCDTREDGSKLVNRTESVFMYALFDKLRMWFFSVHDCWHDYVRQYQSYTFTLDKWLTMAINTHVEYDKLYND